MSSWAINKYECIATRDSFFQFIVNNAAQRIDAFAHVGFLVVNEVLPMLAQLKNGTQGNNSFKKAALTV
jgi:hypothetical protein